MHQDAESVLLTEAEIAQRVKELGAEISRDYAGQGNLLVVGLLKGASIFMADLIREITLPLQIDYLVVSSYGMASFSSGQVKIKKDIASSLEGLNVLLVEDIVDTGTTLNFLFNYLQERQPASLKICSFLDKPSRRLMPVEIAYKGFEVEDQFIIGYGLDYAEKYRNLKDLEILKPEIYQQNC